MEVFAVSVGAYLFVYFQRMSIGVVGYDMVEDLGGSIGILSMAYYRTYTSDADSQRDDGGQVRAEDPRHDIPPAGLRRIVHDLRGTFVSMMSTSCSWEPACRRRYLRRQSGRTTL
jgi:hypothetical protein